MYTQCPDCDTAFRVTAPVLQKAAGRVICGGCGRAFNALERLTEEPPAAMAIADDAKAILETLNELTGPHQIRIEDTGIEWQVFDEDGQDEDVDVQQMQVSEPDSSDTGSVRWYIDDSPGAQEGAGNDAATPEINPEITPEISNKLALQISVAEDSPELTLEDSGRWELQESLHLPASGDAGEVQRYDDNTPLPDDFGDDSEPATPQRRAEDRIEPRSAEADEVQVDLALGEPDDWMDLLDEVGNARNTSEAPLSARNVESLTLEPSGEFVVASVVSSGESDEKLLAPHSAAMPAEMDALADTDVRALSIDDEHYVDQSFPIDIDSQFDLQALEMGIDLTGNRELTIERQGEGHGADHAEDSSENLKEEQSREAREQDLATDGMPQKAIEDEPDSEDSGEAVEERRRERAFEEELATAYAIKLDDERPKSSEEPAKSEHFIPTPTEEEMTINMLIDRDLIRLAEQQDVFTSTMVNRKLEDSPHVETIIMEGEFVRSALQAQLLSGKKEDAGIVNRDVHRPSDDPSGDTPGSPSDDAEFLMDTDIKNKDWIRGGRRKADPPSYTVIGGVAVLALILAAQVVHAYRDSLATYAAFDKTLGPVYRLFRDPLTPEWNVKGWQFETTSGSTDETGEVLTISSRVLNSSTKSLPYPLLHVSLTDRWEEIIGSKVLEPNEYLGGTADPRSRVPAGESFTAVVRVEAPSPEATGFKLNVCYREPDKRVRCATEDFKD